MKFDKAEDCWAVISNMLDADRPRRINRALIDSLANGNPPYTEDEVQENNVNVNVNFLSLSKIGHDAGSQMNRALTASGTPFQCTTDYGPASKHCEWSTSVTKNLTRLLTNNPYYTQVIEETTAQDILHGIGPESWNDPWTPFPDSVAVSDCLVPTGTFTHLKNLNHVALFKEWRPWTLFRMSRGEDKGWNRKKANDVLANIKTKQVDDSSWNWNDNPEKMEELWKANSGYYMSDKVPTVKVWDVYYQGDDNKGIFRKIVLDVPQDGAGVTNDQFLYDSGDRSVGDDFSELIHIRFSNASLVAPFMYHTVRSLGWLLYAVCHLENRLGCKFSEQVFEQMMWFFRASSSDDRDRLQKVDLIDKGIIPDGLQFVTAQERFKPDAEMVGQAMEFLRGKMRDNSASFLQDTMEGAGAQKDPTATYTLAKVNASAALLSALLNKAYQQHKFKGREILRRCFKPNSPDKEVQKFQTACQREGVPPELFNIEYWEVEPERIIGNGNKTAAQAQVQMLMGIIDRLKPDAQKYVLHEYVNVATEDPAKAQMLVPLDTDEVSNSVHDAQIALGALMQGLPVSVKQGVNQGEYAMTLIQGMGIIVQDIEKLQGSVATQQQVIGLGNAMLATREHIAIVARDPNQRQQAKQLNDALGQIENALKGYAQRLQQSHAQNGNTDPKVKAMLIQAQTKAMISDRSSQQRTAQKQQQFILAERRKEQQHALDMRRKIETTKVDAAAQDLKTAAEIIRENKRDAFATTE